MLSNEMPEIKEHIVVDIGAKSVEGEVETVKA